LRYVVAHPQRLLFVVPHYYMRRFDADLGSHRESAQMRSAKLARTLAGLHETFGCALGVDADHRPVAAVVNAVDVVVVTTGGDHLMAELGEAARLATHVEVDVAPPELGFAAHRVLADAAGGYDGFGYLEDDILVHDPLAFTKQRWFTTTFGSDSLLQPNRFEASCGLKFYPDGPLSPEGTEGLSQPTGPARLAGSWYGLDVAFERPSNPHAGCFFVDREQMARLVEHPRFGVPHASFVRSFETAASGPLAETFRVYKAASPTGAFLEVEHQGSYYLGLWGIPDPRHVAEAIRQAAEARADLVEAELAAMRASRSWRVTAPFRRIANAVRRSR
jgi:hypothetical protein